MADTTASQSPQDTFLSKASVFITRLFGSWWSVLAHSLFYIGWLVLGQDLEVLLVIVSLEAIYLCIFILMAENVETQQRDRIAERKRQQDMAVVKRDASVDELSLKHLKEIKKTLVRIDVHLQKSE